MRLLGHVIEHDRPTLYRPTGCEKCEFQGYKGRVAVTELLRMTEEIDEAVARRVTAREMRMIAHQQGYRTLADDALRRVLDGTTSIEEVGRVVNLTDRM